jgi:hypothetical protein
MALAGSPCGRYPLIWVQKITWSNSGSLFTGSKFHSMMKNGCELNIAFFIGDEDSLLSEVRKLQVTRQSGTVVKVLKIPVLPFLFFSF